MGAAGAFSVDQGSEIADAMICVQPLNWILVIAYGTRWPRVRPDACDSL